MIVPEKAKKLQSRPWCATWSPFRFLRLQLNLETNKNLIFVIYSSSKFHSPGMSSYFISHGPFEIQLSIKNEKHIYRFVKVEHTYVYILTKCVNFESMVDLKHGVLMEHYSFSPQWSVFKNWKSYTFNT